MPSAGGFFFCIAVGVPVAFALLVATILLIAFDSDPILFRAFHQQLFGGLENYGLLALPLFMLVGELMSAGGIARRLIALASLLVGRLKGGLAYVNLLANALMASILGSAAAQISLMNRIMTPEMERAGYRKEFAAALSTGGGLLAPILPPSMIFVVYGVLAQVSIGDMFIAGIGPGLIMLVGFALCIWIWGRMNGFPDSDHAQQFSDEDPKSAGEILRDTAPSLLVPIVIVGSIIGGIATPTEAAALASLAAGAIGFFIYKELTLPKIWDSCVRAAIGSGVILLLIAAAQVFGFVIVYEQVPAALSKWISATATSPILFLLMINIILLLVGMFLDAIAALIIVVPLLLPIATGQFGIDPFQFGVIVCLNLAAGLVTPPVGAGLFVSAATTGVKAERIALRVLPFVAVTVLTILLTVIFPEITSIFL
ncbi:MAG: TRAP transporter large permease [Hyphomonadaceae bacterium]|nr:TRAP transporter large permease [Hyphomonadaceae bacterium]